MQWLEGSGRQVHLAVHSGEEDAYQKAYPWAKILLLPNNVRRHAGKFRRFILDGEKKPFFFVDDDILPRFVHVKNAAEMFDTLERHMDTGVPMVAIGKQIFSNGVIPSCVPMNGDKLAIRNKFASTVYGIRPSVFKGLPLEKLVVYEDCALVAMYPGICKKIPTKHTAHGHDLGVGVRVAWSKIEGRVVK
jgi:hypothetical protein